MIIQSKIIIIQLKIIIIIQSKIIIIQSKIIIQLKIIIIIAGHPSAILRPPNLFFLSQTNAPRKIFYGSPLPSISVEGQLEIMFPINLSHGVTKTINQDRFCTKFCAIKLLFFSQVYLIRNLFRKYYGVLRKFNSTYISQIPLI